MSLSPPDIPLIGGLNEVADRFDIYLLDLWGLVHDGEVLYPGVMKCLKTLRDQKKRVVFLSNSPNRARSVADKLAGFGIGPELYEAIVTAGEVTHILLRDAKDPAFQSLGRCVYDIDRTSMAGLLDGLPDRVRVDDPDRADFLLATVVNSPFEDPLDFYDDVLRASADKSLPLLCANPDRVVIVGESMYFCPGAVAERYESMGGRVIRIGKPYGHVYDHALALLGHPDRTRVVGIGDSLATDISGAHGAGLPGIFNLTGIHWNEVRTHARPDPEKLRALLATHPHRPDFVIAGLRW